MAQGYKDTPLLPEGKWTVHDSDRPQPRIVTPGTESTQEKAGEAPSDATILFSGGDLSAWESIKDSGPAAWKLEGDYMEVVPKSGNIRTKEHFGDCQLHVELMSPEVVKGEGQGRGNSGVFMMGLYEVQVLDCFDNPTYADGTTGALYGQCPPLVNASRKPGVWQMYDIIFNVPRFDGDKLIRPASVTVLYNGVLLHHAKELQGPTMHKQLTCYEKQPNTGPIMLQDHNDLVRFRNIWVRPQGEYDQA